MIHLAQASLQRPLIVLFFEFPKAATALTALLTAHDIAVTTVRTEQELEEAVLLRGHVAVITHTARIAAVCRVTCLPVINVEKFIHAVIDSEPSGGGYRSFDGRAFLESVVMVSGEVAPFTAGSVGEKSGGGNK
jgi:hypothetical protein